MRDLISRQAAIDAICTEGTRLERNGTVAMAEIKQWCVDILDALPSAQPETNCSEIPNNSDAISRQQAIDTLKEKVFHNLSDEFYGAMQVLDELPSAQPDIIRCKDCKWFGDIGCAIRIVDDSDKPTENDFCSFAERREDG